MYGSQKSLNRRVGSKGDLTGGGGQYYARSDVVHGSGNGYEPYMDGYTTTITRTSMAGGGIPAMGGGMASMGGGMTSMSGGMTSMSGGMTSMGGGMTQMTAGMSSMGGGMG